MKGSTTTEAFYDEIKKILHRLNIPIQNLVGVVTDGALSRNSGMSALIAKDMKNATGQNLCAKSVKMTNVVSVVTKLVNYIRSK